MGVRDNVGNYVNESLPSHKHTRGTMNIVGTTNGLPYNSSTGAFTQYTRAGSFSMGGTSAPNAMSFDASKGWTGSTSNPDNTVYQDNATVQQRATQMYLYFYVGEYTMSSLENIAGQNMSIVNNKLDIDMNNMNPNSSAKRTISNLSSPNIIRGSVVAMGNNSTCPTDGVLQIKINCDYGNNVSVLVNGQTIAGNQWTRTANYSGITYWSTCPVSKGDVITYSGYTSYISYVNFYPTKGGV